MKFWQKIFLGTLIIFVIAFDAGAYVLTRYAYDFNLQRERSRSLSERYVIATGLSASITLRNEKAASSSKDEKLFLDAIKPYADYYRSHDIFRNYTWMEGLYIPTVRLWTDRGLS